jgi:hypothetical protein
VPGPPQRRPAERHGHSPHQRTLERHFRRAGLDRELAATRGALRAFGRFQAEAPTSCGPPTRCTADALHGPAAAGRKAYLFAACYRRLYLATERQETAALIGHGVTPVPRRVPRSRQCWASTATATDHPGRATPSAVGRAVDVVAQLAPATQLGPPARAAHGPGREPATCSWRPWRCGLVRIECCRTVVMQSCRTILI